MCERVQVPKGSEPLTNIQVGSGPDPGAVGRGNAMGPAQFPGTASAVSISKN
jgi:hypothetical protein